MTSFGSELHYRGNSPKKVFLCVFAHLLSLVLAFFFTIRILAISSLYSVCLSHKAAFAPPPPSQASPFSTPTLPVTSSAIGDLKGPVRKPSTVLSEGPQSQFLPLSGAEVYTHGKLIPVPCLPHITLMSKVVRCVECGVTFLKDRHTVGKLLLSETTQEAIESEGNLMN